MRFLPIGIHGFFDYVVGFIVIGLPVYFGWAGLQGWTFFALGAFVLFYSLITNYELGIFSLVPFRIHLILDVAFGLLMLVLPWALGFSREGLLLALAIGLLSLLLVSLTKLQPKR